VNSQTTLTVVDNGDLGRTDIDLIQSTRAIADGGR